MFLMTEVSKSQIDFHVSQVIMYLNRKHSLQNMSGSALHELSNNLFSCLQCSYWGKWGTLKEDIELLASSLSCYASYLTDQNKQVRNLHFNCHPIRPVSDNLSFQFLPQCHVADPLLRELNSELSKKEVYNFFVVEDLCPAEPRRKYEYLERLKSHSVTLTLANGCNSTTSFAPSSNDIHSHDE